MKVLLLLVVVWISNGVHSCSESNGPEGPRGRISSAATDVERAHGGFLTPGFTGGPLWIELMIIETANLLIKSSWNETHWDALYRTDAVKEIFGPSHKGRALVAKAEKKSV
jgi:hypothetical protein